MQKERFPDPADYEQVKDSYMINKDYLKRAKSGLVVMHPLPRVTEIETDVDDTVHVWYFKQVRHGIYTRMALLGLVIGKI